MRKIALGCSLGYVLGLAGLAGCSEERSDGLWTGEEAGGSVGLDGDAGHGSDGGDDAGGATAGEGDAGESGNPGKFDVAPGNEGGGDPSGDGCQKVDFVFAIDASPSMQDEQTQLLAAFPGFMSTIESTLTANDFRILVLDTDAWPQYTPVGGNGFCDDGSCCASVCSSDPANNWCANEPCTPKSGCQFELGAGKAEDEDWNDCAFSSGRRWLDADDPQLGAQFECAAKVGGYGHYDEQQAGAIVAALDPSTLAAGGCNEGFLRDDAVLVFVLITDEEDGLQADAGSEGEPADWYQAVVDAKGGDPTAVVALGLIGDTGEPGGLCMPVSPGWDDGAQNAPRLREFISAFGARGLEGSVCSPDYTSFFDQAVGLIDQACDDFVPPG